MMRGPGSSPSRNSSRRNSSASDTAALLGEKSPRGILSACFGGMFGGVVKLPDTIVPERFHNVSQVLKLLDPYVKPATARGHYTSDEETAVLKIYNAAKKQFEDDGDVASLNALASYFAIASYQEDDAAEMRSAANFT